MEAVAVENRWGTNRLEAFSDGVLAIAITLLVLDIHVPPSAFDNLWRGIIDQWPSYLAYATSFITIGSLWLAHHAMFRRLQSANQRVMQVNLLLLMAVVFLPFPTRLLAEAIHNEDAERAAVIFYGLSLLVIQILLSALWAIVARDRSLLQPRREPDGGHRDHACRDAEPGLLRRSDRARSPRPEGGGVRLPRDRDRRRSACARRPVGFARDARIGVSRDESTPHLSPR